MRLATVILVLLLVIMSAVPVFAARPLDVEIQVVARIAPGAVDPFTASGLAVDAGQICSSGASSNAKVNVKNPESTTIKNIRVIKLFRCGDGSGNFYIELNVKLNVPTGNTSGNWSIRGGTGSYTNLEGKGTLAGTSNKNGTINDVYTGQVREGRGPEPSCIEDVFEQNDSYGAANRFGSLADGDSFSLSGKICDDEDWYRFNVLDTVDCPFTPDQFNVSVSLSFSHADGDLALQLWGSGMQLFDSSNSNTDDEQVSAYWESTAIGADDSRYLYVRVSGVNGAQNDYQLVAGPVSETCAPLPFP